MIPILFSENSTTYTTNGIGRLSDAISCVVTEQRNGIYELEMEYPKIGRHYSDIGIRKIIVVKPSANATLQAFRIYKISKPINGRVIISAQHICYDLTKNVAMPFSVAASGSACNLALQGLKNNAVETCPFTFQTDVTTVSSYTQTMPASINQRLRGIEGSVLDMFGGEYEWDNWTVKLHRHRGTVKPITLRYGKNITDLDQEENIANTVTGVVPFWSNTDKSVCIYLPERVVRSSNHTAYSQKLTVPLDLSTEFDEEPTVEQLRTKAQAYVNQSGFGLPKVSIKVSFVELADTEEYKDILPLQAVSLCDTITVQFEELGINTTADVVETKYDVLKEKYNSVQIGALKSTLAMSINDMNASQIQEVKDESRKVFAEAGSEAADLIDNATAWLTSSGGYVVAVKNNDGSWKELLFMDTNDIDTARNVLRINENGLGFSKTGVGGPYYQGWTLDGKILIGGSNAAGITVYKYRGNTSQILFQIYSDNNGQAHITWNTENSSMDANGFLTAVNMVLTGGELTLGGDNDGLIEMYDSNRRLRGRWSKTEFVLYNGGGTSDSNIIFKADSDGAKVKGSLDTGNFKIEDQYIKYNNNTYIDMEGGGDFDGIHINGDKVVFSVDELGVTRYRGSSTVRTGRNGNVITSLGTSELTGICCNLHQSGSYMEWDVVSLEYFSSYEEHDTINGLVVN